MQILLKSKVVKLQLKNRLVFSSNQLFKYIERVVHVTQIQNYVNFVTLLLLLHNLHHILLSSDSYSTIFIRLKQQTFFFLCNQMYTNPKPFTYINCI